MSRFIQPTPELQSLLIACQQESDDDTARLVLADYLEERGDVRADMIRASVQLDTHHPGELEYHDARDQLDDWQQQYLDTWLGRSSGIIKDFQRGLVQLEMGAGQLTSRTLSRKIRDAIQQGWVQRMHIRQLKPEHMKEAIDAGRLQQISELVIQDGWFTANGMGKLVKSVPGLQKLSLRSSGMMTDRVFAQLSKCTQLKSFALSGTGRFSATDFEAFAKQTQLTELDMRYFYSWDTETYNVLPVFSQLEALHLGVNWCLPGGVLQYASHWPRLKTFTLEYLSELDFEGLQHLSTLEDLESLAIAFEEVTWESAVVASLPKLKTFHCFFCTTALDFGQFASIDSLEEVNLKGLQNSSLTIPTLPSCSKLKRLDLSYALLSEDDLQTLSQIRSLQSLILISAWGIEGSRLKELATLPELRQLYLNGTQIPSEHLRALADCQSLRELDLTGCLGGDKKTIAFLQEALPHCRIVNDG